MNITSRRYINPYTGVLDPFTDFGALNADLVKFFLFIMVNTKTTQKQEVKYAVELKGFAREMMNDFYVKAGLKGGTLEKRFGNSGNCTTYFFRVQDTVMELEEDTARRLRAIDDFKKDFKVDESDGQYKVTAMGGVTDANSSEVAETVQELLNIAKTVTDDWEHCKKDKPAERQQDDDSSIPVPDFKDKPAVVEWFQRLREKHETWAAVNDHLKEIKYPKKGGYSTGKKRGEWIRLFVKRYLESAE